MVFCCATFSLLLFPTSNYNPTHHTFSSATYENIFLHYHFHSSCSTNFSSLFSFLTSTISNPKWINNNTQYLALTNPPLQTTRSWSSYGKTAKSSHRLKTTVISENHRQGPIPLAAELYRRRRKTIINIYSCKKVKWLRGFTIQSTMMTILPSIKPSLPISSTRRRRLTTTVSCKILTTRLN